MAHHAYFYAGDRERGIAAALLHASQVLEEEPMGNPDVVTLNYELFSVDDARSLSERATLVPYEGTKKVIIVAVSRIFHEAQNALLKLFEEPPTGTTLILVVPSEGNLISTLRSRLHPLPKGKGKDANDLAEAFAEGNTAARGKIVEGILDDAKSDKDEEKHKARATALHLAEGLARIGYQSWKKNGSTSVQTFLTDLGRLIPVLHDRAAPLKPILEHLLITAPRKFD